jgi:hypothetical protein
MSEAAPTVPMPPAYTDEQRREWEEWLSSRPNVVQDLARRFPPWVGFAWVGHDDPDEWYRVVSYSEDGTMRVVRYERELQVCQVFGVTVDRLTPTNGRIWPTQTDTVTEISRRPDR